MQKRINIGPSLQKQLSAVGINTFEDLQAAGSKEAWLRILEIDDSACIHRLYALEGAIRNIYRYDLPEKTKEDLLVFYRSHKK